MITEDRIVTLRPSRVLPCCSREVRKRFQLPLGIRDVGEVMNVVTAQDGERTIVRESKCSPWAIPND